MVSDSLACVALLAGVGRRMKSERPKVLHSLLGRPLGWYALTRAMELRAEPIVAVVGHQGEAVQTEMARLFPGPAIQFAIQSEQRGTGHAVLCARQSLLGFKGAVLVLYGDVPLLTEQTLQGLVAAFRNSDAPLALLTCRPPNPHSYGRVLRADSGAVRAIVEERDATPEQRRIEEVNAGVYIADADFLFEALHSLRPNNAQGEIYLTDIVAKAVAAGGAITVGVAAEEVEGVNCLADLALRAETLRSRINAAMMANGVTLEHPATTFIDEGVEIGPDTILGSGVAIGEGCTIGSRVVVGQGCVIRRSVVGDDCELKPYSVLEGAVVAPRCQVGPFARLRGGTRLDEGVHVGNFVETKQAHLMRDTKANHHAYLGDTEIGERCNIGAGTITCNYDGFSKHVTRIGSDVFVGSDTQLVAPVVVGDNALIGAGSTIVRDVPAGSLALSRAPQSVKEGWVEDRLKILKRTRGDKEH